MKNPDQHASNSRDGSGLQYDTKDERRVITGSEQATAVALGEIKPGQLTRENHKGTFYTTAGPDTNAPADETKKEQ